MSTHTIKVDIATLLTTAAENCKTQAATMGALITLGCLERIAKRACELGDEALLQELETLCLVDRSPSTIR
jgi:hypothetical protein